MSVLEQIAFYAAKITISAKDINVPTTTANVGVGMVNIVKVLIGVIGMLAIVAIIAGGIQFALSTGNSKRVQQARETIIYAVVGLVVAIAAYAVVTFITGHL